MIDPRGMALRQWTDAVVLSLDSLWSFARLDDENRWRDWAVDLLRAPTLAQRNIPDPYQFSDWRTWAERAYPMLETV